MSYNRNEGEKTERREGFELNVKADFLVFLAALTAASMLAMGLAQMPATGHPAMRRQPEQSHFDAVFI